MNEPTYIDEKAAHGNCLALATDMSLTIKHLALRYGLLTLRTQKSALSL